MIAIDVLIMAAGGGTRLGSPIPKQFLPLADIPMLRRALAIYQSHLAIRHIQVVIGKDQEKFYQGAINNTAKLLAPIIGGAQRQDSVLAGLEALKTTAPDYVLIADAARPFTSLQIIDDVIAALASDAAVLTAIPVADTIKHFVGGQIQTIQREGHYLAQTPQAFPFTKILELHRALKSQDFTDDVALFEAQGLPVKRVPGNAFNFKITTSEDFQMAEALLQTNGPAQPMETRIGHGFDHSSVSRWQSCLARRHQNSAFQRC